MMTVAVVARVSGASAAAAAHQQDQDQNDPQAAAVVAVVPHIVSPHFPGLSHTMFCASKSSLTYENIFQIPEKEGSAP